MFADVMMIKLTSGKVKALEAIEREALSLPYK